MVGKMCLMLVEVNTSIESVDEKGKPLEKHYLMEENNVLKSHLLEGGLNFSIFDEAKKEEGELSFEQRSLLELNKTLKIKSEQDVVGMNFL